MENEALKDYEIGEWILYTIGEDNLGLGEISGFEVEGSKPEDVIIRVRVWTGPDYTPKASDVLCNVTKKGSQEADLIWVARKASLVDEFCQKAKRFTADAFNELDRSYNHTLRDSWDFALEHFIKVSANMVNVRSQLMNIKVAEENASKNKG